MADLIDEEAPPLFKKAVGSGTSSTSSRRIAEIHGTAPKNQRGELPAILLTPDNDDKYGEMNRRASR